MTLPSRNVDELRNRLRALGYLDAGVDRFVVSPAAGRYGAASVAVRVSVRIGLLAALLLGPAAAIGLAARLPGLISGPRDALVVTLFLAAVFGAALFVVAVIAALIVDAIGRRATPANARRAAFAVGTIVGVGCLVYLTLWWNATGSVWVAPVRSALALGAAVIISLVIGYAVTIAALALRAREDVTPLPAPVVSWRAVLLLALAAFIGASALLARSVISSRHEGTRVPDFAVVPTGARVRVIGIDGFDPRVYDEMFRHDGGSRGLNHLSSLFAVRFRQPGKADTDPARVWTTIGTGMRPDQHGVSGLELRRVAGLEGTLGSSSRAPLAVTIGRVTDLLRLTRPGVATGMIRHQKMFWEVAADKGLDAAVVNWWATWPATSTNATVISDRAVVRLERGGPQAAEIAPPALYEPLRARWPSISARARAMAVAVPWKTTDRGVRDVLIRSATLDAEQALLAVDPLLHSPDLLAVYLPGLDIAQHALLQETAGPLSVSELAGRVDELRRYYAFLDSVVALLTSDLPVDTVVVTVTHPGRAPGDAEPTIGITGYFVRENRRPVDAQLTDVAPTVLYLLGLPISRAMSGRPLLGGLDEDFVARFPVRYVDTYGPYSADVPVSGGTPLDKETLERLRSLGYIQR